jgi:hypothetical protein
MTEPGRRRVVYRQFRFVKPHRVHRSPQETVTVWRRRVRSFAFATVAWLVVALSSALANEMTLSLVSFAAGVFSGAAVVKGLILIRRNSPS